MELPNFDTPQQSDAPAPRKPRQKPTKRRKVAKKKAIVKTRRPARKVRKQRVVGNVGSDGPVTEFQLAAFIFQVYGWRLEPWQMKLLKIMSETKTSGEVNERNA